MSLFDKIKAVLRGTGRRRAGDPQAGPADAGTGSAQVVEPVQVDEPAHDDELDSGTAPPVRWRRHTVLPGETLETIAEGHGVGGREMAELNGLTEPELIYPGQVFKVPHA